MWIKNNNNNINNKHYKSNQDSERDARVLVVFLLAIKLLKTREIYKINTCCFIDSIKAFYSIKRDVSNDEKLPSTCDRVNCKHIYTV
jgi:hypothetical protein